jgi:uncharacterized membrane protein YkoI
MKNVLDRRAFLAGLAASAAWAGAADADRRRGGDHERARRALKQGEVRPLAEILADVRNSIGGEVIEVELDREDGRYVYELTVVSPSGRLLEVKVDAATGAILEVEDD